MRTLLTFGFALWLMTPAIGADQPSRQSDFVDPSAKLELLFDGGCILTEGVAVAPDGKVFFSDITFSHQCASEEDGIQAGNIWVYDPETESTQIYRSPSGMSNGLKFDAQGRLLAAEGADFGGRRVVRTDMQTGRTTIIAWEFEGRRLNSPNDITIDEQGRVYFSDPRYLGHETVDQAVQSVYRVDPDGSVHRVITDAGKPNGVAISPDQRTLYVVSNDNGSFGIERDPMDLPLAKGRMALQAYDLSSDGTATFRETLVDYSPEDGPDGLVVDTEGNIWAAARDLTRPGVHVYSPTGEWLAYIPTEVPTNVGFGRGSESKTLYITAGKSLYRIKVKKDGYQLPRSESCVDCLWCVEWTQ